MANNSNMPGGIRRRRGAAERALDTRDILNEIFQRFEPRDARIAASITEVNNTWWDMGFPRLWGHSDGQLGGLVRNVRNPERQQMYANTVRHIHILPGDTILADNQNILETLDFPRLESINYYFSNLTRIRPSNIEALMVPTLRTVQVGGHRDDIRSNLPEDLISPYDEWDRNSATFLNALSTICASLTTLTLPRLDDTAHPLILDILDRLTAIEHLDLGGVSRHLPANTPPDVLLHKLLGNKSKLVTLSPPQGCEFDGNAVEGFLRRVGPNWSLISLRAIVTGHPHIVGFPAYHDREVAEWTSSLTVARLFAGMPSLERFHIDLKVSEDPQSAAALPRVIDSISKMSQLKELDMELFALSTEVNGDVFMQLSNLSNLETLSLDIYGGDEMLPITGVQLAAFFAGVSKLKKLQLRLGKLDVSCTPAIKTAIEAAIARIEEVDLENIAFIAEEEPAPA